MKKRATGLLVGDEGATQGTVSAEPIDKCKNSFSHLRATALLVGEVGRAIQGRVSQSDCASKGGTL